MALTVAFPALAQKITVTGTVYDQTGEPLISATVLASGSSVGTATDIDGNYSINVEPNGSLTFSYVGFNAQTVAVNGRTHIDVTMSENTVMLDEVVAIGYGVVKKSDATGSVAMVKPDEIEAGLATSAQDLLVGASPGVVVTTDGGSPTGGADIRIRGGSSLSANNNPLIVIDGVPMSDMSFSGTNAMTMVSPDNIESMTILKDASATAIYGSRASNGVIIITTKKGQSGKPQVNFSANFHVNTARKTLNMMNAGQFREAIAKYAPDAVAGLGSVDTDWQDEVLRTSFSHDYSLSVGGQAGFLPYRFSASYTNNQGILLTSGMQRTTAGVSLTPKFFNNLLQINANLKGSFIKVREADTGSVGAAVDFNPTVPVRTAYATSTDVMRYGNQLVDGVPAYSLFQHNSRGPWAATMFNGYTTVIDSNGTPNTNASQNPVALLEQRHSNSETLRGNGNLQIDYALHFLPTLHLNLNLGFDVARNTNMTNMAENSIQTWTSGYNNGAATYYHSHEVTRNTLLDFYANWRDTFEDIKSTFDIMAGYSWQRFDYFGDSYTTITSLGYQTKWLNDDNKNDAPTSFTYYDGTYNLAYDTANDRRGQYNYGGEPYYWGNKLQLVSFFGRFNYSFDDTYLLTFTLRDDGTSRFSKDNRWGLFPSLALGWKLINMPFMEKARGTMNDLKLRLGWGITGQQDLGGLYNPYLSTYQIAKPLGRYPDGKGGWLSPLYPNPYDENIKWEETTTWNVGLDLAFLNNRITAAIDWYLRDTNDLLAYIPVAAGVTTSNFMNRNIGSLRNIGVEATITAKPVVTKDFTWTTAFNVAWNKNRITKLTGNAATDSPMQARGIPSGTGGGLQYFMVDEPAFTYRVYQQVYDQNGDPVTDCYVDQNDDGVIDSNDLINYHSPDPKVTMTWNNTFNYKNWDFGIVLRASLGNYVYNNPRFERSKTAGMTQYGYHNLMADTYIFDVASTDLLALSSHWIENASFLRCDNITLGYTFDNLLNNALRLRLFGAVQNPFVITSYKGLDPEVFTGIDNNCYPRPITATFGVVATF